MRSSLRRRLLITLLSITAVIWLFSAWMNYRDTRHEIGELFDAQMAQTARTLLSVAGHELAELDDTRRFAGQTHIHFSGDSRFTTAGHEYEHKMGYQLWQQPENTLMMRSFNAPEAPLNTLENGYSTETIDGEQWRVFSLFDPQDGFMVKIGEALAIRDELTDTVALRIGLPLLFLLPVMALLILLGINRTLRPLRNLAHSVSSRSPSSLDAVDDRDAPCEITPLVDALNRLFLRLSRAFESERRFTADAAHELRTPLAALKIQAQVAKRSNNDDDRNQALNKLLEGVERATRLVEQLLTMARVDPEGSTALHSEIRLDQLCQEVLANIANQARVKEIELELDVDGVTVLTGLQESLEILLRNLLDNAIRYTPRGGRISVRLTQCDDGSIELHVGDSGPGIPESERSRIFDRFYRLAGQNTEGSGLGLSIVQRIAELNRAEVKLGESELGGLEVTVHFQRQ
jgi:two-component system, OmpR family, sensor histidine kinase QseC